MSPALFVNVLRQVMANLLPAWERKKYGVTIGELPASNTCLHYLSFADDTTLFARSKRSLQKMLEGVNGELAAVGLKLNADKCKVQCSTGARGSNSSALRVGELRFPVVSPTDGFDLLGTTYTLEGGTSRELQRRISIAWGKFHQIWHLLRHRSASLRQRLRLFNAVVGRSLLWGAESWTLTVTEKKRIRSMQRSMLRRFAGPRRQTDEDFLTWIRRSTRAAVEAAAAAGVRCWVKEHLRAKWSWAGHLGRMGQYRPTSWAFRSTFWRDAAWKRDFDRGQLLHSVRPLRSRAGRWNRWEDEIVRGSRQLDVETWASKCTDKKWWDENALAFADAIFVSS